MKYHFICVITMGIMTIPKITITIIITQHIFYIVKTLPSSPSYDIPSPSPASRLPGPRGRALRQWLFRWSTASPLVGAPIEPVLPSFPDILACSESSKVYLFQLEHVVALINDI